jgi:hypothetical protein
MSPIPSTSFSASYDSTTKLISAAVAVLFLLLTAAIHYVAVGCLAALVLAGSYAWSPRSYSISQRSILVKRLIGAVRIPLDDVRETRVAPGRPLRWAASRYSGAEPRTGRPTRGIRMRPSRLPAS